METTIHARAALTPDGWRENVRLTLAAGTIRTVETGAAPQARDERCIVLVPGMPNLHAHAFQRAMAGLAQVAGATPDSFWTWRVSMYEHALRMTPDDVEAVAARAYAEMLEAGYTRVGEFHYLHHDRDGRPYANPAEMAARVCAASAQAGIGMTLLPVFYAHSDFGGAPPAPEQRRFVCDRDLFGALHEACRGLVAGLDGGRLGVAPHSLRAVTADELADLVAMAGEGPIHIHIAEQMREVEACRAATGASPVAWLLDNAPVDGRWCLVHATHMEAEETARLACSGAVAGLCPITEADLGDGVFPARAFRAAGGRLGIGTDSNVRITLAGELRQLEYAQRLAERARNVLAPPGGSTGRALLDAALEGGASALGVRAGLAAGASADVVALGGEATDRLAGDCLLDAWIFARDVSVERVWARGRLVVREGRHVAREAIDRRFTVAMRSLSA
jgi:formimidoylglutamate deiminase